MDFPANIDLQTLPGPKRGEPPTLYARDEIVWSPDHRHFAVAYTICEASMCNYVGQFLIGRFTCDRGILIFNPVRVLASCWQSPWCRWLDNSVFVFKAQHYVSNRLRVPLVLAHVDAGFCVVAGSDDAEQWCDVLESSEGATWTPWAEKALAHAIEQATGG